MQPSKTLVNITLAGVITLSLFSVMDHLIRTEFTPQEKSESQSFEINPKIETLPVLIRTAKLEKIRKIETPPPPPVVETVAESGPTIPVRNLPTKIPPIEPIDIDISTTISLDTRDEQPIFRPPPTLPVQATKSGHCLIAFDVSASGAPFNIAATSCSQSIFRRGAIKAVGKWKYRPKVVDGTAVARAGLTTKISFQLLDERGNLIPE